MSALPSEFDLYTSKTVPNALDSFSSYTYVITLSMLPMSFYNSGSLPIGTKETGKGKIIIAQTGVTTKFNIDNLDIESVVDVYGSTTTSSKSYSTKLNFTVTEPLGSSLLSLMNTAFERLRAIDKENFDIDLLYSSESKTKGPLDLPYMIEVDLIGHRDWNDETDKEFITDSLGGQEFDNNFATYVWPFYLTQFTFEPRTEGTEYAFEGVTINSMAAKLPAQVTQASETFEVQAINQDMSMAFQNLADKFTEYIANDNIGQGEGEFANHQIIIELGKLYDNQNPEGQTEWHKNILKDLNPKSDLCKEGIYKETSPGEDEAVGEVSDDQKQHIWTWTFKEGRDIEACIEDILKTSNNFKKLISDREVLENGDLGDPKEDPMIFSLDIRKSLVIDPNGKPSPTGGPAYNVTYVIDMKLQGGVKTINLTEEPDPENTKSLIDAFGVVKQYDYMFTGINDQVINVDISFPQGQVFLFAKGDGITPTYKDSPAIAQNQKKVVQQREGVTSRLIKKTKSGAATTEDLLNHFKQLGSDLKDAVSNLGKNTRDVIQGIKDQADAAKNVGNSVANKDGLSRRLPSSPKAIYTKSKSILNGTKVVDSLFADIQDFQRVIEEAAEDLAGGLNVAAGQIAQIVADSANPFEFTSGLGSKLGELSSGIDGLVGNVNNVLSGTGLSLSPQDIPGLGEAQQLIDDIKKDIDSFTPSGFSNSSGWQNDYEFESIDMGLDPDHKLVYLEELDFEEALNKGSFDPTKSSLRGTPIGTDKDSNDTSPSDHLASVILSYSQHGVPYLVQLTLTIKGDPYWFGRENLANSGNSRPTIIEDNVVKEEFAQNRADFSHAPYGAGSVYTGFRYIFPKEYSHYDDNYSSHTGVAEITKVDPSYSGYYMVVQVVHNLSDGLFTQRLSAVKTDKAPNHPIFTSEEEENAE